MHTENTMASVCISQSPRRTFANVMAYGSKFVDQIFSPCRFLYRSPCLALAPPSFQDFSIPACPYQNISSFYSTFPSAVSLAYHLFFNNLFRKWPLPLQLYSKEHLKFDLSTKNSQIKMRTMKFVQFAGSKMLKSRTNGENGRKIHPVDSQVEKEKKNGNRQIRGSRRE